MDTLNPRHLWGELKRQARGSRSALLRRGCVGRWRRPSDLLLDAFEASAVHALRRRRPRGSACRLPRCSPGSSISRPRASSARPSLPVGSAPDPPDDSIAVLPFANLSNEPENEYFSDGLAEEIRNQLARVAGPARGGAQLVVRLQGPPRGRA